MKVNYFDSLPDEIIILIFTLLKAKHLIRLRITCRRFQIISQEDQLWKRLINDLEFRPHLLHQPSEWKYRIFYNQNPINGTGYLTDICYYGDILNGKPCGFGMQIIDTSGLIDQITQITFIGTFDIFITFGFVEIKYHCLNDCKNTHVKTFEGKFKKRINWLTGNYFQNIIPVKGIATFDNGRIYEGWFKRGKAHGLGVLSDASGEIYRSKWSCGNCKTNHFVEFHELYVD